MKNNSIIVAVVAFAALSFSSCTKQPIACVDSAAKSGTVGQAISFDASCSSNASGYHWDFGDGASAHSPSASHAYNSAGTYTAKVKTSSKNGKKEDEKTVTVTVN